MRCLHLLYRAAWKLSAASLLICRFFSEVVSDQTLHFGNRIFRSVRSGMGFYNISCVPDFIFAHHLGCIYFLVLHSFTLSNTKPLDVSKRGRYGRLLAQLHGSFTPAHACGCGAQCFESVQRASIFNLPVCRRPQAATLALQPGVDRSLMGGHGAPAVWLDTEQNVSVCLILRRRPPAGLSFSKCSLQHRENENRERVSCFRYQGRIGQFMLTIEWMSLISNRRFMYSSTRTRGWPSGS